MIVHAAKYSKGRAGYTLVEVLIAGVLVTVMMLAVWSLLRTWSSLYDKGQTRAQQSQLVRSLSDQLTEDIQSAVVPTRSRSNRRSSSSATIQANAAADLDREPNDALTQAGDALPAVSEVSSFDVREVSLVGGKDWLVLDVVRSPTPWNQANSDSEMETQRDLEPQVFVPDLQRVIYTFAGAAEDDLFADLGDDPLLDQSETPPGLLRLTLAREFVGQMEQLGESNYSSARGASLQSTVFELRDRLLLGETDDLSSAITSEETREDEAFVLPDTQESLDGVDGLRGILEQDFVPEVSWLEFRYFSGSGWSDSWDSSGGRGLPVAVEIRFEIEEVEPVEEDVELTDEELPTLDDEASLLTEESLSAEFEDPLRTDEAMLDETQTEETPYHRCVVVLGLAQPPQSTGASDLMGDILP
jgi:hypothetical protein